MEDKKFGNVWESSLNRLFLDNAEENNMNYSHKKGNQWNLWVPDSGLVLSFITYKGKMTPCLVGIKKETLERFYLSNLAQIDLWIKKDIKYYFEQLELLCSPTEISQVSQEEVAYVRQLVQKKKGKKAKSKQVEGQLSFKDMGWKL